MSSFGVKAEDASGDNDNDNTSNLSDTDPEDDNSEPTVGWGLKIVGSINVDSDMYTSVQYIYFIYYGVRVY